MASLPGGGSAARGARWKRLGAAGFLFFFVKGLFWLALAAAALYL